MPGSFSPAILAALIACHMASVAAAGLFLAMFRRVALRRRALVQSLAITSDDDEEWLARWKRTEKRQSAVQIAYVMATIALAASSILLYVFQPHWL